MYMYVLSQINVGLQIHARLNQDLLGQIWIPEKTMAVRSSWFLIKLESELLHSKLERTMAVRSSWLSIKLESELLKSDIFRLENPSVFLYKRLTHNLPIFLIGKNLAEHWDLPNTGIFYSKDVASELDLRTRILHIWIDRRIVALKRQIFKQETFFCNFDRF
jgi:hypothetical protein